MKIICIGRNYAEHAAELHEQLNDSGKLPEEPMFFLKPDTALLRNNDPFYIPSFSQEVHYECELVVRINRVGKAIAERFAHRYYDEVGLGIDFTARDLQRPAHGRPALHRNASRRGPRPPRRHTARCARRTRTVKFRHQMNLEKRLFRNRKKAEPLRKTFHLSPLIFHLYTCCSTTNSNPTACCWRRSRRGGGS